VLKTYNGGIMWHKDSLPTINDFQSIEMLKTGVGYLSGDSATFFQTNNYGISWSKVTTNIVDNINNLKFYNDSCGYALNEYGSFGYIIYETQDGGKNWSKLYDGEGLVDNYIRCYTALGKDTLFRMAYNGLYVTTNAGISWDTLYTYLADYSMAWQNRKVGYVSNGKDLYKTIDGGTTFNFISDCRFPVGNITIINDSTLIVSGNDFGGYGTSKTTDGGKTWRNYYAFVPTKTVFINKDLGYMVEENNVYKTTNGCISTYDNCPNIIIEALTNTKLADVTIAPNPMELNTFIDLPAPYSSAHYKLYNNLGQMVDENTITPTSNQILRGNKPSGIYILSITNSKGDLIASQKLIIK
jgi:photosystem II stability/assembly factor-like uncharacterized protein